MSVFRRPNGPWPAPRLAISRQSWGGRANEGKSFGWKSNKLDGGKKCQKQPRRVEELLQVFLCCVSSNLLSWVSDSGRAVGEWKTKVWRALSCHFFSSNFSDSAHRRSYMFTQCDQTSENMKNFHRTRKRRTKSWNLFSKLRNFSVFNSALEVSPQLLPVRIAAREKTWEVVRVQRDRKNFFLINSIKLRSWWSEKVQTDTESECAVSGEGNSSSQGQLGVVLDVRARLWMKWRVVVGVFKSNLNNFSICHSQSGLKKHSRELCLFLQR